jgi:hypothetical protein
VDRLAEHLRMIGSTPIGIPAMLDDGRKVYAPNPKWKEAVDWLMTDEALDLRERVGHTKGESE